MNSDRVQRRVQFEVVGGSKAPDQARSDKAPRTGFNALSGVGRRAVSSEQHELANLEVQSPKSFGPNLVARRVYRVQPTSELQTVESETRNDYSVLSAEPRMEREVVGVLEVLQMTNCLGLHRQLKEQPRNCDQGNISIQTL